MQKLYLPQADEDTSKGPLDLRKDESGAYECNILLESLKKLLETLFYTAKVNYLTDGTLEEDYFLLSNSEHVLCAFSTFCLPGVFANTSGEELNVGGNDGKGNHFFRKIASFDVKKSKNFRELLPKNLVASHFYSDRFLSGAELQRLREEKNIQTTQDIANYLAHN